MRRFFASHPATAWQAALWVAVYALMSWQVGIFTGLPPALAWRLTTHLFGDLRALDVAQGQVWRVLTANFLHYNVLHLAINLVGLVQLGRMIEEWYGAARFLLVCLLIGIGGNLASATIKLAVLPRLSASFTVVRSILGGSIDTPSAGGSIIVCGLVGLIAVVGWRSGTRFGQFVKGQMLAILGFTVLLGVLMPWIDGKGEVMLDNLGHACGAAAGAVVGLAHRRLLARPEGREVRWPAVVAAGLLVAGFGGQAWAFRRERPVLVDQSRQLQASAVREVLRNEVRLRLELAAALDQLGRAYQVVAGGWPQRISPLDRAMSRRAYRAGVPPHWLSWPPPLPQLPEPVRPEPQSHERLDYWLRRLTEPDSTARVSLDAVLRAGPSGGAYRSLRARAHRARYVLPTDLDRTLFLEDLIAVNRQLSQEFQAINERVLALEGRPAPASSSPTTAQGPGS
jgi:membrane associated rhomboid family serine protease